MNVTVFPHLLAGADNSNPYIQDFIQALNHTKNTKVINAPHKNPLKSLLYPKNQGDCFIFHWIETTPERPHGILQPLQLFYSLSTYELLAKKSYGFCTTRNRTLPATTN